jgi:crossover junction endodeoxyribonuclease RusA
VTRYFILPYPDSVNSHYRRAAHGQVKLTQKGAAYRENVVAAIWSVGPINTMTGRVKVTCKVWAPDRRKRDLDNLLKALLDAMEAAKVYKNDAQIDDLRIVRAGVDHPHGRVEVQVAKLNPRSLSHE